MSSHWRKWGIVRAIRGQKGEGVSRRRGHRRWLAQVRGMLGLVGVTSGRARDRTSTSRRARPKRDAELRMEIGQMTKRACETRKSPDQAAVDDWVAAKRVATHHDHHRRRRAARAPSARRR